MEKEAVFSEISLRNNGKLMISISKHLILGLIQLFYFEIPNQWKRNVLTLPFVVVVNPFRIGMASFEDFLKEYDLDLAVSNKIFFLFFVPYSFLTNRGTNRCD